MYSSARFHLSFLLCIALTPNALAQFVQQGNKLVGTGFSGAANQGRSVALSADGNTAIVGGPGDNSGAGAAWIYVRTAGVWGQQGNKLTGAGGSAGAGFGWSVALSADGNTALIGGPSDSTTGAVWVFTRTAGVWSQQGNKLVGTGAAAGAAFGWSVALSTDGNTALIGGPTDGTTGSVWVFTRSAGVWSQQGSKFAGTGGSVGNNLEQGRSVGLSGDGNTAIVGGPGDTAQTGAVWIFTRTGGVWSQQGGKLVGTGGLYGVDGILQGYSAALSADGNTAFVGGRRDNVNVGAGWVFTRTGGVWTQQGAKLVTNDGGSFAGYSASLSADGNTAFFGGRFDNLAGAQNKGAGWVFKRTSGVWSQQGTKLSGNDAVGPTVYMGTSVAISSDGGTAAIGDPGDNTNAGAAWIFTQPVTTHFAVTAPGTAAAGTAINFTVTALDGNNNVFPGYSGTVHFTSSDGAAVLPADVVLTNGTGTFSATLKTAGNRTLTATDTAIPSITGISGTVAVTGGTATHFIVSAPATAPAGAAFNFTVTARDAFNNTATGYAGTVSFTSSDVAAVLPANGTLTNGTKVFSATLNTAGSRSVTATDTVTASITGNSGTITVGGLTTHFAITAPPTANPGMAFDITVTALDAGNNIVPNYAGTVQFSTTAAVSVLPLNATLVNGTRTFQVNLKSPGNQTVTATDTAAPALTATSATIVVAPWPSKHFRVTAPATVIAGTPFDYTVTALDTNDNVILAYSGILVFSSTDPASVLPRGGTLVSGTGTFSATLKTGGTQSIAVSDNPSGSPSATGDSGTIVVTSGAPARFSVSAPAGAAAGTAFNITVASFDAYNNPSTGYAGTVRFTSSDGTAVLPANGPLTNGTGTFSATLKTTGSQTITAIDTVTTSITGTSSGIAVTGGPATQLAVVAPGSASSGTALSFTVTALDAFSNPSPGYAGTVRFTSSDGIAVLPANAPLTNGTGTFSATLKTTGNQTITATDTVTGTIAGSSAAIVVGGGVATHFTVTAPAAATAGTASNVTVTALDALNNVSSVYTGTVHFTSSDGSAALPTDVMLTNGTGTFSATFKTAGNQTITATDTVTATLTGISGAVAVAAGATARLAVTAPGTAIAGTPVTVTVTAQDSSGNPTAGYAGTVLFSSSDAAAVLPPNAALTNGTGTFSVTLKTAGNRIVTATDTVTASITGSSATVATSAGAVTRFAITPPASVTAGTAFNVTVIAKDAYNNTNPNYAGTVHLTSSDTAAILPADTTLTTGSATLSVTLKTAGNQTITATDTATAAITAISDAIPVTVGTATRLVVVAATAAATAGTAVNVTVTAQDGFGNTAASYGGTVHFTSTDGAATVPADAVLTNGVGTFAVTLKTAGNRTITATDTVTATITGASGEVEVTAGAATKLSVTAPATAAAGTAFNVTVLARDAFNNPNSTYAGTVHLTSSDAAAVLPADATLANGTGTLSVTLRTGGNHTVTATDTVTASIAGTSSATTVGGGAATRLVVSAPATASAGTAVSITVTAQDLWNNTSSGYAGTVQFTSTDGNAVLPANATLTNGIGTFSATLKTLGNQAITATDTVTAAITGVSGAVAVAVGAVARFGVTAPATAIAGTPVNVVVTAQDAGNNPVTSYTGTVHITSSDGAAVLPADAALANGTGTFAVTLKTGGNRTVTATDTVTASITGVTAAIAVAGGAATKLVVSAPSAASAGTPINFIVSAQDAFDNVAAGYAGTVRFTSTDSAAVLPANSTLTNGTGTLSATFRTAGNQTLTAADTVTAAMTATTGTIAVAGGAATHFAVSAPASATAGTPITFMVTALDAYNNVSSGYPGTVHFTSSDLAAFLPADGLLTNGTRSFQATMKTPGNQAIMATDTVATAVTGSSATIMVPGGTQAVSAEPGWGSGLTKAMTFTFSDPHGWQHLDVVNILIGSFLDGRNACYLAYSRTSSVLYLVNDAGTALLPALALGGSGSTGNQQCTVTATGSSATGSGNTLTLILNLSFGVGFAGNKAIYLAARDLQGDNTGWQALGTWAVPGSSFSGPQVSGLSPARSSGSGVQPYTFTFADTNGWQDLGVVNVLVNDALNGNRACYLAYSRADNVLYLVNDEGNGLLPGLALTGSGTLGNSQCTVTGSGSWASGSGDTLTLTLNLSFGPGFVGNRLIYMAARSNGDVLNSGWRAVGSRTVN